MRQGAPPGTITQKPSWQTVQPQTAELASATGSNSGKIKEASKTGRARDTVALVTGSIEPWGPRVMTIVP